MCNKWLMTTIEHLFTAKKKIEKQKQQQYIICTSPHIRQNKKKAPFHEYEHLWC